MMSPALMKPGRMHWVLAVWLCAGAASAQPTDLLALYQAAQQHDARFASAQAARDAGLEALPQGRAGLLPQISLGANTAWNSIDNTWRASGERSQADFNNNGWSLTLTQPLYRWQNWVGYTQSKLAAMQAEARFTQASQDLVLRVTQAYFDVLQAQEVLTSAQGQKAAILEQLAAAQQGFEAGTTTITDTHEAQARHDLAEAQVIAAENDLLVKRQVLRKLVGQAPGELKTLSASVTLPPPQPADIQSWVQQAEQGNIDVQVAERAAEMAEQEVAKQQGGHYPTLDLVAARGRTAVGNNPLASGGYDSTATTVGLQVQVPLFAGGYTTSKTAEASALHRQAVADLDETRREAALQARQAFLGVTSGLAQVKALQAAQVSSQSALDLNKLGYEVGVRINIDVLNAQSQYFDTRQRLMKARLDTLLAQLRLKAAVGHLGEADLRGVNGLLQ